MTEPPDYGDEFRLPDNMGEYPSGGDLPSEQPGVWGVGAALNYGWKKYTDNLWPMIVAGVLIVIVGAAAQFISQEIHDALVSPVDCNKVAIAGDCGGSGLVVSWAGNSLFAAIDLLLTTLISAGVIKGAFDMTDGKKFDLAAAYREVPWKNVLLTALAVAVLTYLGFALFIIPGLIITFFTFFALFIAIDEGRPPHTSIMESVVAVRTHLSKTLLWWIVGACVALFGYCLCFIGAIVTVPVVIIATAFTYRKFANKTVVV